MLASVLLLAGCGEGDLKRGAAFAALEGLGVAVALVGYTSASFTAKTQSAVFGTGVWTFVLSRAADIALSHGPVVIRSA